MITEAQSILMEEICEGEGTSYDDAIRNGLESPYDITFGYGAYCTPPKPISQMTMSELDDFQVAQIHATKGHITGTKYGSSATGRPQCIRSTLAEMQKKIGWSKGDTYSKDLQDRIFVELLKRRGYDQWIIGNKTDNDFQIALAQEWASIAMPGSNKSYYGQPVGTTDEEIKQAMREAKQAHEESLKPPPPPLHPDKNQQLVLDLTVFLTQRDADYAPFESYNHMADYMVSNIVAIRGAEDK